MDEREWTQRYVDQWMTGRSKVTHRDLHRAYAKAEKLYSKMFKGMDAPEFGFVVETPNEFDDWEDE